MSCFDSIIILYFMFHFYLVLIPWYSVIWDLVSWWGIIFDLINFSSPEFKFSFFFISNPIPYWISFQLLLLFFHHSGIYSCHLSFISLYFKLFFWILCLECHIIHSYNGSWLLSLVGVFGKKKQFCFYLLLLFCIGFCISVRGFVRCSFCFYFSVIGLLLCDC